MSWDSDDGAITEMLDMIAMDSLYAVTCIRCMSKNVVRKAEWGLDGRSRHGVYYFCQACGKTFKIEDQY